jgi:SAM-dependent methyltransferase
MSDDTTSQEFFESKYQHNQDPWNFASSPYEQERYEITLKALHGHRYQRAFEPGCSIGVLTERLASCCDQVEAIDISPAAVAQARIRCRHLSNVVIRCAALPGGLPEAVFDLIVLSEIGYYFTADRLKDLSAHLISRLPTSGTLLATHWLGVSADHLLSGDEVHAVLGDSPLLVLEQSERYPGFRLDRWSRI